MSCILAGDLGGTKALLALYRLTGQGYVVVREQRFACADYGDFSGIIADFLRGSGPPPQVAVFGVAGPVAGGKVMMTNLGWLVDQEALRKEFGFAGVLLVNDLVAMATALPDLPPEDFLVLNQGEPVATGSMAVLAPGTGLGEAYLCWNGEGYTAFPSEGGHADFAPASQEEEGLLAFLRKEHGHVSYERVCSGSGIPNIYRYLTRVAGMMAPPRLQEELEAAADPTPVILAQALAQESEAAMLTIEIFLSILAAEAGNAALKFMATGGLYLGGGLLPRLLPALDREKFMDRFTGKGRLSGLLAAMPVRVVTTDRAVLNGAALLAKKSLSSLGFDVKADG